jgi:hypothetical protein
VVVGDTGCRIEAPSTNRNHQRNIENCNNPEQWPFSRIAQQITALQPDLVIHVGDVNDRDAPCPDMSPNQENPNCRNRPGGDTWPSWYDDFFQPAAPFLRVAPLVILRGSHEECSRNGGGWFRLLDPHAYTPCLDYTDPYAVSLGNLQLLLLDSAHASDANPPPPDQVDIYRKQIETLRLLATEPAWFVTHKGVRTVEGTSHLQSTNRTLQQAGATSLPTSVKLTLAGHEHFFEVLSFHGPVGAAAPPQIVNTSGGDYLLGAPPTEEQLKDAQVDMFVPLEQSAFTQRTQGFIVVTPGNHFWNFSLRDDNGREIAL